MNEPKKKKLKVMTHEQAIQEFAEYVAQQEVQAHPDLLESRSARQERIKNQVIRSMAEFNDRFVKGYEVLLDEVLKQRGNEGD